MKKISLILTVLLTIIIFSLSSTLVSGCKNSTPKQLDVYVWEGYVPESVAALFEQETGIKLNINFIDQTSTVIAFLEGGGKADIVMPTQSYVYRFYEGNLAQPLDLKRIKNYENVSKSFMEKSWTKWDGKKMGSGEIYVIPYVYGTSGLVVNTSKYTKSLDNIGWDVLFDTDLKGRVTSKNDNESVLLILDMLSIPREDLITDPQGTLDKIMDKAIELKNNVLKFYASGAEVIDLMKNEEVWVSNIWDGGGRQLEQFDAKFKYVLPKEGGMAWTDTFMIPTVAENPDGAHLFIDFMLRPDIAAKVIEQSGYTTTVEGALDMTESIDKELYRLTEDEMANLNWSPNWSKEAIAIFTTFWEVLSTVQ